MKEKPQIGENSCQFMYLIKNLYVSEEPQFKVYQQNIWFKNKKTNTLLKTYSFIHLGTHQIFNYVFGFRKDAYEDITMFGKEKSDINSVLMPSYRKRATR